MRNAPFDIILQEKRGHNYKYGVDPTILTDVYNN